ncbi:hypothetical protein BJ875DRAFT_386886 [Amylocarpus encephaloides]|uniref:Uncharacterized protein n=1 Tax=Amylocarpus encephaloides TaxID=45428 RepID=A0A9P8C0R5_9HELO|nr:hypothetical protein BJ875DRAFT_386886 [Amylocarpus encephaloides]
MVREQHEDKKVATEAGDPSKKVAGEAFLITNGEPIEFWGFASLVWRFKGYSTPLGNITIVPMWLAFFIA